MSKRKSSKHFMAKHGSPGKYMVALWDDKYGAYREYFELSYREARARIKAAEEEAEHDFTPFVRLICDDNL